MVKTSIKKLLNTRLVLIVMMIGLFGLGMASVPASKAYACGTVRLNYTTPINDSYGHNQGILSLHENTCNDTVWATFLSNTNTWKTITVYTVWVEYPDQVFSQPAYYNQWKANTNFDAGAYPAYTSECYFAALNLTDNRGDTSYHVTSPNNCF